MHTQGVLVGRERERERIDRLLADARGGKSGALIIRGEPGSGKTALLEYAYAAADGARIARARGVESESDFAYAGLHELVGPVLGALDELPAVQADALRGALALAEPQGTGRLFVGAATLSLLSAAAGDAPLLCIVDDAHRLDGASLDALLFAARRLELEGVAMLFATTDDLGATGLETLELAGLDSASVAALLGGEPSVATEVTAATGGNPRAVVDLAVRLSQAQLSGAEPLPHPLPVGPDLEEAFAQPARTLSDDGRRVLVIAATADTRSMRMITRADNAKREAFEECEEAGLLTVADGQVEFNHPLFRVSAYQAASPAERRDAHRALAEAFGDEERYAERRAWHAAAAAVEPDEDVARGLEEAADAAQSRRAHVTAAAMFERAARLTPDAEARARRLYLAAHSAWLAGRRDRAVRLLDDAAPRDALVRADVAYLRARIGVTVDLRAEAAAVESLDSSRAAVLVAAEADAATGEERRALAQRASELAKGRGGAAELVATLALARAEPGNAIDSLERAKLLLTDDLRRDPELLLAMVETIAMVEPADTTLMRDLLAAARTHAVLVVPRALVHLAWLDLESGRWQDAAAQFAEAAALADEQLAARTGLALLDALMHGAADVDGLPLPTAQHVLGLAELGKGRGEAAVSHLAAAGAGLPARGVPPVALELVAALVRARRADEAAEAATTIEARTPVARWAAGLLGERAELATAADAFAEQPFLRARVRLDLGEALLREGARRDARVQLEAALETFEELRAEPWAERARRELRASGGTRVRTMLTGEDLTPRELQVARAVVAEASYKDAAAKLYLSPKTVEYHLSKVFNKLGISSGRQLAPRLAEKGLLGDE